MKKIKFQNGAKIKNAVVVINEEEYQVIPAQYQGNTPLSSFNLNNMQDNIEEAINRSKFNSNINVYNTSKYKLHNTT